MSAKEGRRQHGEPLLIPSLIPSLEQVGVISRLRRVRFLQGNSQGYQNHDEWWLQRLIHQFPQSLPISEIEPGIGMLIPIGMEMETPAGFVDNVFITAEGNIVLAECKLWRNPEARRQVVAQIIDYAQSISKWGYEEFDAALRRSIGPDKNPLGKNLLNIIKESVNDESLLQEEDFIDAISRNLRLGRILLLVIGDGIREGSERLLDFLQMHAGFHFTLAMVEMAVFEAPGHGFFVQPRVMTRTLNIERAIVRVASEGVSVEPALMVKDSEKLPRSMTMSEEIFLSKLAEAQPETERALKIFLDKAGNYGVFLDPATKSASLKWQHPEGQTYNLGGITLEGKLNTYSVGWVPSTLGQLDLAHEYLMKLSQIVEGWVRQTPNQAQWYIVKNNSSKSNPDALDALNKADAWLQLIDFYITRLKQVSPQG